MRKAASVTAAIALILLPPGLNFYQAAAGPLERRPQGARPPAAPPLILPAPLTGNALRFALISRPDQQEIVAPAVSQRELGPVSDQTPSATAARLNEAGGEVASAVAELSRPDSGPEAASAIGERLQKSLEASVSGSSVEALVSGEQALGPKPDRLKRWVNKAKKAVGGLLVVAGLSSLPACAVPVREPVEPALPSSVPENPLAEMAAQQISHDLKDLAQEALLSGHGYFTQRDHPVKISVVLKEKGQSDDPWYPEVGPKRRFKEQYFPQKGEKTHALEDIELAADKELYDNLADELETYGAGRFKSAEEKAKRIALFMAPRLLADLEIERIREQAGLPLHFRVDILEELRFKFELAALRRTLAQNDKLISDPGFIILPSEYEYLEKRFGLETILIPPAQDMSEAAATHWSRLESEKASEHWSELGNDPQQRWPFIFSGLSKKEDSADAKKRVEKWRKDIDALYESIDASLQPDKADRLQIIALTLEGALDYLEVPGFLKKLSDIYTEERAQAEGLDADGLSRRLRNLFSIKFNLTRAAIEEWEGKDEEMADHLGEAEKKARLERLAVDFSAIRGALRKGAKRAFVRGKASLIAKALSAADAEGADSGIHLTGEGWQTPPFISVPHHITAWAKAGSAIVPALVMLLEDPKTELAVRRDCLLIFYQMRYLRGIDWLSDSIKGDCGGPSLPDAVPAIIRAAGDKSPEIRRYAALTLGKMDFSKEAISAVYKAAKDNSWEVRRFALVSLLDLYWEVPFPEIKEAIGEFIANEQDPGITETPFFSNVKRQTR